MKIYLVVPIDSNGYLSFLNYIAFSKKDDAITYQNQLLERNKKSEVRSYEISNFNLKVFAVTEYEKNGLLSIEKARIFGNLAEAREYKQIYSSSGKASLLIPKSVDVLFDTLNLHEIDAYNKEFNSVGELAEY